MKQIIALFCGALFGAGLLISGMADPIKVIGFLDFSRMLSGTWDPSLMLVMGGALLVYVPSYHFLVKPKLTEASPKPLLANGFHLSNKTHIDKKLLLGAGVFGLGWGIAGICPGPALVNLAGFDTQLLLFVFMMLLGMFIGKKWQT